MAVFRPELESDVCKLNFDDKFTYELPLHEEECLRVAEIADKQLQHLKGIKGNSREEYDKVYNLMLDGIDEILGEGAGADIMSLYNRPSLLNIGDVLHFITNEYNLAYNARLNKHKADATVPNTTHPANAKRGRR